MIEAGLQQRLAADAGVSALAGTRIYPLILPETMLNPDATVPAALTYQVISALPEYTLDGALGLVTLRVQIDCWATVYGDAKALLAAVTASLDCFTGTLPDGTSVANLWREDASRDDFDHDSRLYRVSADFRALYTA